MSKKEKHIPFFIIGMQRSGTTLLRLILNNHSKIAVPEESTFLMPFLRKKYLIKPIKGEKLITFAKYLKGNAQFKAWDYDYRSFLDYLSRHNELMLKDIIARMFESYCQSESKQFWADKTPSFFRKVYYLHKMFPEAKIIHILRDGRDVFNSWRKIDPSKNNEVAVALEWVYKNKEIEKSTRRYNVDRLAVRYEDLISNPEKIIKDICDFVQVEYEPQMLQFYNKSRDYIGTHHSSLIFGKIDSSNCYKWERELTDKEKIAFEVIAKNYLKKYRYDSCYLPLRLKDYIQGFMSLIKAVPRRIRQVFYTKYIFCRAAAKGKAVERKYFGNANE